MAPSDLRTRAKDLHEPVWNDLLLAGRSARFSRHCRSAHAEHRASVRFGRPCRAGSVPSRRRAFDVLAFCRWRLGRRLHRRLRGGSLRRRREEGEAMASELPAEKTGKITQASRYIAVLDTTAWQISV